MSDDLSVEREGRVAVWTITRAHRHNSFGGTLLADILVAADTAATDPGIGAVVTRAEGPTWCVGGDAADLGAVAGISLDDCWAGTELGGDKGLEPVPADDLGAGRWALKLRELAKPLVAAVNGPVGGGGLGLAMLHDIRVASTSATFGAGFANLGLGPELGLSVTLPAVMKTSALEFLLGGEVLTAQRAADAGIVDRVVSPEDLDGAALATAQRLAARPIGAIESTTRLVRAPVDSILREALTAEWAAQRVLWESPDVTTAVNRLVARVKR